MNAARVIGLGFAVSTGTVATTARADDGVPPPHVVPGETRAGPLHARIEADALYGIGGQSFLGVGVQGVVDHTVWHTRRATGTLGGGLGLVYHNEPTFLAPWLDRDQVRGATHRIQALALAVHTFHMGKRRRFSLGIQVHSGLNHWRSDYRLEYPDEGLRGDAVVKRNHFVVGGLLRMGVRVAPRVGVHAQLGGPFPTGSSYVLGMFQVGLGLTIHLR